MSPGTSILRRGLLICALGLALAPGPAPAEQPITVSFRDTPIAEVYETLSRQGRVNVLLGKGVNGNVSVNLYEVSLDRAIRAIAAAAGFVVEVRDEDYYVVPRDEAGKDAPGDNTEVRTFKVQYTSPETVSAMLKKHLSRYGKITSINDRRLLVVEDLPPFLERVEQVLTEIDAQPRQILIEARILEVSLSDDQSYGIDWTVPFRLEGGPGTIGTAGLASRGVAGLFVEAVNPNFEMFLNTLRENGRVRTLSTPKLLVTEDQQAEVLVGDRTGFRVTTTINQITTESIQFVDSGVILRVTAAVDGTGQVLLDIHPEVSNTTVTDGIPSVTTTQVTTQFRAEDGQKIFIGGLIKRSDSVTRKSPPLIGAIPVLGALLSRNEKRTANTETIVLITPHIVNPGRRVASRAAAERIGNAADQLQLKTDRMLRSLPEEALEPDDLPPTGAGAPGLDPDPALDRR